VKRLLIIRHAKSSWDNPDLTDFDRPLNKRGKRDLPDMAERLKNLDIPIDLFVSSPAKRAFLTAIGHAKAFGIKPEQIRQDQQIYHASSNTLRRVVSETNDRFTTIALFGHNPGLTDLINDLCDADLWNLPTCSVFGIAFDISSWSEILQASGRQFHYDFPKSRHH